MGLTEEHWKNCPTTYSGTAETARWPGQTPA
jgi:hypothetical protein